jgi:hypothetical protein
MLNIFVRKVFMWEADQSIASFKADPASLWEYVLCAEPDKATSQKLGELLQHLGTLFPIPEGRREHLHVCLASFHAKEMMEETLIRWMDNICRLEPSFGIQLNNFSGLPSPHTLFIRIPDPLPFNSLLSRLKMVEGFIQANECPPVQWNRPTLALASGLPEAVYSEALNYLSSESFTASFTIKKLVMLRRWWEGDHYEFVRSFHLVAN